MEKKLPKKKSKPTEIQRYIDRTLDLAGLPREGVYHDVYFNNHTYDVIQAFDIKKLNSMTEKSVSNAVKKSKHFKMAVEKLVKTISYELAAHTSNAIENIEEEQKYQAKEAKRREDIAEEKRKTDEQAEKLKAQKAIFSECLTSSQKKALKKFYNVKIE